MNHIAASCQGVGVKPYLYEHGQRPGHSVADKVQQQVIASDAVVVLLTKTSATSAYVQQEIGFAVAHGKPVLPLIEKGMDATTLTMLDGVEHVTFDPDNPDTALGAMVREISRLHAGKQDAVDHRRHQQDLYFIVGLVALMLIGSYLLARTSA